MVNHKFVEINDVVAFSGRSMMKGPIKCAVPYYGIVISFTCNDNPRVYPLFYGFEGFTAIDDSAYAVIRHKSAVCPGALRINKEDLFSQGGEYYNNYNIILKVLKHGKSKNKGIQLREKKETNFSF